MLVGGSVLCRQLGIHYQCPFGAQPIVPPPADHHRHWAHVCQPSDLPARRIRHHVGEAMTERLLAELAWVNDRQMQWAREIAVTRPRRESSGDLPGHPPRLWTLPTYVVRKLLRRVHPHQPQWPQRRRNCDRWHVIERITLEGTRRSEAPSCNVIVVI